MKTTGACSTKKITAVIEVLIKAYRGILWKAKQNKNSKENNWREERCCKTFYDDKIAKTFSFCKNNKF
jgi:hypothetical protein